MAYPEVSTATQKVELTQDTASSVRVESASVGVDQVVPLKVVTVNADRILERALVENGSARW